MIPTASEQHPSNTATTGMETNTQAKINKTTIAAITQAQAIYNAPNFEHTLSFLTLVLQALDRCGDPAAAVDEIRRRSGIQAHDGAVAEKPAEIERIADLLPDGGDDAHRRGLGIDHADGGFVRD